MANQLDILKSGQIIPTALHQEMQQSYLEYAMSVIVGRALPDVRDGLKPVHRRILYAMHELGLTPDRPFRKCARVVGDVLGKYHPHGDQSVYDALVRLVQEFSTRYPLLGGHGNFGSVDNDPPAAMRYTETRLAPIGNEAMLTEIGEATVDFVGNFDNSQQEPTVLPAQLPFLLLNGSSGIAVGMATNIPPHNLNEVVDGLIALIDNPELPDEKLLKLIPGPDFPTGGVIMGTDGIREAYLTGRGSIIVRGVHNIEEMSVGKGKHRRSAIIITELPYQVNKAGLIEKIAELVNAGKIVGISDLRDESDREGIRVVIELKRDADTQKILDDLHRQTALQNTFGTIMLALTDRKPKQMTLREALQKFLAFREETLTKRYRYELDQLESRQHIVEGWLLALSNLDDVIDILRNSPDGTTAKSTMQDRFDMSDRQADAVLGMPLRRLTGLERTNLQKEFQELTVKVAGLQKVLNDRHELLKAMKKDLRSLKKQFGDARRTRIVQSNTPPKTIKIPKTRSPKVEAVVPTIAKNVVVTDELLDEVVVDSTAEEMPIEVESPAPDLSSAIAIPKSFKPIVKPAPKILELEEEENAIELTHSGLIRRVGLTGYEADHALSIQELEEAFTPVEDPTVQTEFLMLNEGLLVLTAQGKIYPLAVKDIPKGDGVSLLSCLPSSARAEDGAIVALFTLPEDAENQALLMLTKQGKIKRIALSELSDVTNRGLVAFKLKDGDRICQMGFVEEGDQLVVCTSMGRVMRVEINRDTLPLTSRTATGGQLTKVLKLERFVGWAIAGYEDEFLMVSAQGYGKRMTVGILKLCNFGDLGQHVFQFTQKSDVVVGMTVAFPETSIAIGTQDNQWLRLAIEQIPLGVREDKGEQIDLVAGQTVAVVRSIE
jgi:DNA gyrase subunit A